MFWCLRVFFFFFLLSVECWHSPTHSLSLPLSKSLTLTISTFPREKERERGSYCMVCCFCGSHYVNLLFVYLFVFVCLFICVSSEDGMILCLSVFAGIYTSIWVHVFCQMESKYCISVCSMLYDCVSLCVRVCMRGCLSVCVCWVLCGPQWVLLVHCRPGVSPLCSFASQSSAGCLISGRAASEFSVWQLNPKVPGGRCWRNTLNW